MLQKREPITMNKIEQAIKTFYFLENKAAQKNWINQLHPLSKLLVSLSYVCFTVSFPKYTIFPLLVMCCYPLIIMTLARISLKSCLHQINLILLLVCAVGIFNPIFDRTVMMKFGPFFITSGLISMLTLMLKGILAVLSSYLLIATTSLEEICYALSLIHIPDILISTFLLSYRQLILLLSQLDQMGQAYHLRAVRQNGIHIKAWGSFIGYFLLHSMDRAQAIYESMALRGFHGILTVTPVHKPLSINIIYTLTWIVSFIILRFMCC